MNSFGHAQIMAEMKPAKPPAPIAALYGNPLQHVFSKLDLRSLCSAVQVCHEWRGLGTNDELWHNLASQKWPLHTMQLSPHYVDHKDMLKHDNVHSALPVFDLASQGKCSSWRYNRPSQFYQCRLIALQYARATNHIRLSFDVRGEPNLRRPQTSYIAFVIDKPQHDYNPHGTEQPEVSTNLKTAAGHNCELFVDSPGHFQGTFEWSMEELLPCMGVCPLQAKLWFDISLVFCYANSVFLAPSAEFEGDYTTVEILRVRREQSITEALESQRTYHDLPGAPERRLKAQTHEEELALWHSLPPAVHARRSWWK